jgi:hypothetical protein
MEGLVCTLLSSYFQASFLIHSVSRQGHCIQLFAHLSEEKYTRKVLPSGVEKAWIYYTRFLFPCTSPPKFSWIGDTPLLCPLFPSPLSLLHPTIEFKPPRMHQNCVTLGFSAWFGLHLHAFTPSTSRRHASKSWISFLDVYATLCKLQLADFFFVKSLIRLH